MYIQCRPTYYNNDDNDLERLAIVVCLIYTNHIALQIITQEFD